MKWERNLKLIALLSSPKLHQHINIDGAPDADGFTIMETRFGLRLTGPVKNYVNVSYKEPFVTMSFVEVETNDNCVEAETTYVTKIVLGIWKVMKKQGIV